MTKRTFLTKGLRCPSCQTLGTDTVVVIEKGSAELTYAACENHGCKFTPAQRQKLLEKSVERIEER